MMENSNINKKEILLKDLCSRLPYDTKVHIISKSGTEIDDKLTTSTIQQIIDNDWKVLPYLRPMYSLTEEEIKELGNIDMKRVIFSSRHLTYHLDAEIIDWFNANHVDYRGLIGLNLAIPTTKEFYQKDDKV